MSLDNFSDYKVKQKYTPSYNKQVTYSTLSDSHTRPAYPQVKEISADYNQVTRKAKVNWNLSAAPTQNCIEDNMVLTIKSTDKATNAVETTTQNIQYMAGKTAYSYEFDVPLGKSLNYEFSIKRSHTGNSDVWNNAFSKHTSLSASASTAMLRQVLYMPYWTRKPRLPLSLGRQRATSGVRAPKR